jgi:TfoX/Sxy family transcriptional regulator of competence genes
MPYNETLATEVRKLLGPRKQLSEKKMFGGVGFLLNGNICCGAWKEYLILRLGDDAARQVLGEEHARPFDITGRPMRGWAMVEPAGWRDASRLHRWITWAVDFTDALPAKNSQR